MKIEVYGSFLGYQTVSGCAMGQCNGYYMTVAFQLLPMPFLFNIALKNVMQRRTSSQVFKMRLYASQLFNVFQGKKNA